MPVPPKPGIEFTVRLTKRQAEAALRSEGLHNGLHGCVQSKAQTEASDRILEALMQAYNESIGAS